MILIRAVIASSKLNGWSETGLALGLIPPMANTSEYSFADTSPEHPSADAYSASCYDRAENFAVLAGAPPRVSGRTNLCRRPNAMVAAADLLMNLQSADTLLACVFKEIT